MLLSCIDRAGRAITLSVRRVVSGRPREDAALRWRSHESQGAVIDGTRLIYVIGLRIPGMGRRQHRHDFGHLFQPKRVEISRKCR